MPITISYNPNPVIDEECGCSVHADGSVWMCGDKILPSYKELETDNEKPREYGRVKTHP